MDAVSGQDAVSGRLKPTGSCAHQVQTQLWRWGRRAAVYDALYPSNMQMPIYLTLNAAQSLRDVTDLRTTEELIKSFTEKNTPLP